MIIKTYCKLIPVLILLLLAFLTLSGGANGNDQPIIVQQVGSPEEALELLAKELGVSVEQLKDIPSDSNHSRIVVPNPNKSPGDLD